MRPVPIAHTGSYAIAIGAICAAVELARAGAQLAQHDRFGFTALRARSSVSPTQSIGRQPARSTARATLLRRLVVGLAEDVTALRVADEHERAPASFAIGAEVSPVNAPLSSQ